MLAVELVDIGLEFGGPNGGSDGKEELVTGVGGGVSGCGNLVAVEGGFGGCGGDQVAHGELMKCREISVDFFPAAAGEEGYPGLGWIEVVLGGVGLAREGG